MSNLTTNDLLSDSGRLGTSTAGSPISRLNEDVLWQIFYLNANMDNDVEFRIYPPDKIKNRQNRALFITLASSQVCSLWRRTVNNSPTLWAQLVDLDGFSSVGSPFKDEIIHRTGSSALWMYGKVFAHRESERDFFVSTFTRHWSRFRRIRVTFGGSNLIPDYTWKVLYEPAKLLETISLRSTDGLTLPLLENQNRDLFAGDAPALSKFTVWKINFNFGNNPGWMLSIRHLNISYLTSMSITQWLNILQQTPQLEYLSLIKPFPSPADVTQKFSLVNLPNLEGISIIHELAACVVFLDHLLPRPRCNLQLNTPDDMDEPLSSATLAFTQRVLSRYLSSWFNGRPVESFVFSISHKGIRLSEHDHYGTGSEESLFLQITCQRLGDLPTLFSLLDAFSSCKLDRLTTLHFEVDIFPDQSLTPNVFQFLLTMPRVEILKFRMPTTPAALLIMTHSRQSEADPMASDVTQVSLFPRLHTIYLESVGYFDEDTVKTLQEETYMLLSWRREDGLPVKNLNITALKSDARIEIFEGLEGLKVIYLHEDGNQIEHLCRGNPGG